MGSGLVVCVAIDSVGRALYFYVLCCVSCAFYVFFSPRLLESAKFLSSIAAE